MTNVFQRALHISDSKISAWLNSISCLTYSSFLILNIDLHDSLSKSDQFGVWTQTIVEIPEVQIQMMDILPTFAIITLYKGPIQQYLVNPSEITY